MALQISTAYAQNCNIYLWNDDGSLADGPIATNEVSRTMLSTEEAAYVLNSESECSYNCCSWGVEIWGESSYVERYNGACIEGTWFDYGKGCDYWGCDIFLNDSGTWDVLCYDADLDGIPDDGDNSTTAGDNLCTDGNTENCDDNCPSTCNPQQLDADGDDIGDLCDWEPGCTLNGGCGQVACETEC